MGIFSIDTTASQLSQAAVAVLSTAAQTNSATTSTTPTTSIASTPSTASTSTVPTTSTTVTSSSSNSTSSESTSLTTSGNASFIPDGTVASNGSNTGAIAGGVGVGGLIGLISLIAFFMRRARKRRNKANSEFQEFCHTVKGNSDDESFDHGFNQHLSSRFPVRPRPTFPASSPPYYYDIQHPRVYTENYAGFGSHGIHVPKSRSDSHPVNQGAAFSNPIHPMYNQPPLYSVDAPVPFYPYTEQHFDQQDLPRLAVQIESTLTNDYVGSSVLPYQAAPRGLPISASRRDFPPKQKGDGDYRPQSGEDSPFADSKFEPTPNLRRNTNYEDAYGGIY